MALKPETPADAALQKALADVRRRPEFRELSDVLDADPEAGPDIDASSHGTGGAVESAAEAWSLAVFGAGRSLRYADPRFTGWLQDPDTRRECLALLETAHGGETHFGLIQTPNDGVVAVCAAPSAMAGHWTPGPLDELSAPGATMALVAFAPSLSSDLVRRAGEAFDLTPLESRLVEALMEAPTLNMAAQRLSIGRDAAKTALAGAMRKVGVERSNQLIGRIVDLICGAIEPARAGADLPPLSGLTGAEARVALAIAGGDTAEAIAGELGLTVHTVKTHRKAIFAKLGVQRNRDLSRLMTELQELRQLAGRSGVSVGRSGPQDGRLRVVADDAGRRVAMIDYGPATGRPIMVGHGLATGLRLPGELVSRLQAAGYRPLSPQRPGFGLTDPANGDYPAAAADDMAVILDRIRAPTATLIAREGGAASAIAFGQRHPERLTRALLLNPRSPKEGSIERAPVGGQISRFLLNNPRLIEPFFEMLRRQTRTDLLHTIFHQVYDDLEVDRTALLRPEVRDHLVRDVQGLVARTSAGVAAEHRVYAEGWRLPEGRFDDRWTVVYCQPLWTAQDLEPWRAAAECRPLEGAGQLAHFTHPEALIAML